MPLEGFENAPIVKAMLFTTIGSFLVQTYASTSISAFRVETARIVLNGEYWRFLSSQLTFQSSGELMVALPVMYMFRQFERQLGSKKFALHVLVSIFFSCTLQLFSLYFMPTLRYVSPGPYAFIFAMYPKYYSYVPKLYPKMFSVFGLALSDKVLCYLLGAQLAFNDGRHSVIPAISGVLVGLSILGETSLLGNSTMPNWIARFCSKWVLPLLSTSSSSSSNSNRRGNSNNNNNNRVPVTTRRIPPTTRSTTVDTPRDEDIQSLMSLATTMGLGRDEVLEALRVTNNRVQEAANLLLARSTQ